MQIHDFQLETMNPNMTIGELLDQFRKEKQGFNPLSLERGWK